MKKFKFFALLLVMVTVCVGLVACGDDNDEPGNENLQKIMPGVWAQDGDNDILVINSDGTLFWYDNEEDYQEGIAWSHGTWSIKGEWVNLVSVNDHQPDEIAHYEMRPIEIYQNKIVWKWYDDDADEDEIDNTDAFGNYTVWTWERYNK